MNVLAYVHLRRLPRCTGVGRVIVELTERLAVRDDLDLRILAERGDYDRVRDELSEGVRSIPMKFFSLETSWQQARWLMLHLPKAEEYWSGCDVVWCPAESYVPVRKARLAVTVHDVACFEKGFPSSRGRTLQRLKWSVLFRVLERRAAAILTVSQFSAERIAHFFPGLAARVHIVRHGVPEQFLGPVSAAGEAATGRLGLNGVPFVLVPGGLSYRKNAPLILAAWALIGKKLPEVKLVVAGPSEAEWAGKAGEHGDSVRLLGYVGDETLHSLYSKAAVVWFPSRYEGFGMPVIEAMACGAPLVTTRAAAIPEVAGNAAVLLDPDQPGEHAEAILAFFQSSDLRNDYRRRAVERAAAFTWAQAVERLAAVLKGL